MSEDFYYRRLPHFQPFDATFFVTFRLKDSLPSEVLLELQELRETEKQTLENLKTKPTESKNLRELQYRYFGRFDDYLDRVSTGPFWLKDPVIAEIVAEAIHFRNSKMYDLLAFCVMPNHVHLIFEPIYQTEDGNVGRRGSSPYIVTNILENLKWFTAFKANQVLSRSGAFWQHESYDHVIRENELENLVRYVIDNPVKAGLVKH
ncbi:MAG: hypothetical protein HYY49_07645 [Ignavibacteriales bacterium]|nr:hypothetical protein [Ignavibacteriales bacterium]